MFKKDRYAAARGGTSQFLDIYCAACGEYLAMYQKDGPGKLLRMYLDRIVSPKQFCTLLAQITNKKEMKNFTCSTCEVLIGVPMVYEKEKRLAFHLIPGSFKKKRNLTRERKR